MTRQKKDAALGEQADLRISVHQFAESLGRAMAVKALWACSHSEEVARVAEILALAMGLEADVARMIHLAGHLHDIGKIGIPDCILNKPDRLSREEYLIIQEHAAMGEAIVRPVMGLDGDVSVPDIVRHHHERFDGLGYPDGLRGSEIPLGARIIAVADSLSAMLQNRPYKAPMDFDQAVNELHGLSGSWYDPAVIEAFESVREDIRRAVLEARDALPLSCTWALCEQGPETLCRFDPGQRDLLTGLHTRRSFDQHLRVRLDRGEGVCLALIDCDHFRDFNASHGQEAGDRVLVQLGRIIRACVRDGDDYPFRFGRDVLGVAFACCDPGICHAVCERIRHQFAQECSAQCTVSVGVAHRDELPGCDAARLVSLCRRQLLRAKNSGRNRIYPQAGRVCDAIPELSTRSA